jgi:type VI secretion system protein ImpF
MGHLEPELIVTQSVLDRLVDDEPKTNSDPAVTYMQSVRQFKALIKRDLEWLLNTRQTPLPAPEEFQETSRSLFNYGLPDIAAMVVHSSADRNRLLRMIEDAIRRYEPRIANARVVLDSVPGRTLRFRIEGMMRVDPAPEQVSFDTVLELTSGEYEVK